jgi:hypothetical protein
MDTPHEAEAISVRFCCSLTPLFLKKRRHEPWHSCIELSRLRIEPAYNVYVTKFRQGWELVIPKAEICDADHIIQRIDGLGYGAGSLCPYGKAFMAWSVLGVH